VAKQRTLQEEENRRLEIVVENHEVPQTVRSRSRWGKVNPRAIAYRRSAFDEARLHARRNREWRFPDLTGAVDCHEGTWHEIPEGRDSAFGDSRRKELQ
jgi:hypothetical protein